MIFQISGPLDLVHKILFKNIWDSSNQVVVIHKWHNIHSDRNILTVGKSILVIWWISCLGQFELSCQYDLIYMKAVTLVSPHKPLAVAKQTFYYFLG